ncbi:hypothetical protein [Pandoraea commovens]|uniref:Uncharacterized protein n=1 Tax=Pandoraea commovens TaxID=2508289 RepID=A0A5E4X5F0_9BURK|nr:hypothetical protein [Pandoraea commovens]VVE31523.1 hypothetical protein PCO31010_03701 [Pandoraea commovens]
MREISAAPSLNFPVQNYPNQSLSELRIDRLTDFTCKFDVGQVPSDSAIDDFMSHFSHMGLRDMVLSCLSDTEKKRILCRAARCHVATFGPGRDFLERRKLLDQVDQDAVELIGALPAPIKEAMITSARIGDYGQIVLTFPDIGLRVPLGRTLLGTGAGALTTDEVKQLLMYQDGQLESLLEKFSAGLGRVNAEYPDNEACHVWYDLIQRCVDGKPINQFSNDPTVLGMLASALRALASRVSERGLHHEFPIPRMLTNSAIAYFHADDPKSCAESLIEMGHGHQRRRDFRNAASANKIAADVLAGAALDLWNVGRYDDAEECRQLAYAAYVTVRALAPAVGGARATVPPEQEGYPPPLMLGPNISQSGFEKLWAARKPRIPPMQSSVPPSPTRPSIPAEGE